eukprot:5750158-Karenia_brevis.AAC.1
MKRLSPRVENELSVGLSMGSKINDFSYVWRLQEHGRLSPHAENELRVGLSMGSKSNDFS